MALVRPIEPGSPVPFGPGRFEKPGFREAVQLYAHGVRRFAELIGQSAKVGARPGVQEELHEQLEPGLRRDQGVEHGSFPPDGGRRAEVVRVRPFDPVPQRTTSRAPERFASSNFRIIAGRTCDVSRS